jgi:hypothetical protein
MVSVIVGFFLALMAITVIAVGAREFIAQRQAHRERLAGKADTATVRQTQVLEQRVRVLERIATDRGIDVADEIEKLREPQN